MAGGLRLPRHAHGSGQLVFVLGGSYFESWESRRVRLVPGSVLYRPPRAPHANQFPAAGARALVVAYQPARLGALAGCRQPLELPAMAGDLRRALELELERGDRAASAALEGLALLLQARAARAMEPAGLAALAGGRPCGSSRYRHAEPISLQTVAAEVGVHRATLAAAFRRHLDRSVGEADPRGAAERRALGRDPAARRARSPRSPAECGFFDRVAHGPPDQSGPRARRRRRFAAAARRLRNLTTLDQRGGRPRSSRCAAQAARATDN